MGELHRCFRIFVHDVLSHPASGLLWIAGILLRLEWATRLGDRLHEVTVHELIREDEVWPMLRRGPDPRIPAYVFIEPDPLFCYCDGTRHGHPSHGSFPLEL